MAQISYNKCWKSKFDNIVSKRDNLQDMNVNELKLVIHDSYKKDEKITTGFEHIIDEDVINKTYLDKKMLKKDGRLSFFKKENDFRLRNNKQSVQEVLIQRALEKTIQILNDKGLFDNYASADKVLEDFLLVTRRRGEANAIEFQ